MELFLNILWFVIATLGLCVWRVRWAHQQREHRPWRQGTAFASALVLLFFTVSLTDDLHSELVYFEECAANRRHTACLACPHPVPQNPVAGTSYVAPAVPNSLRFLSPVGSITPKSESLRDVFRVGLPSGRSPPVLVK
jgi:hypothetical protein